MALDGSRTCYGLDVCVWISLRRLVCRLASLVEVDRWCVLESLPYLRPCSKSPYGWVCIS